VVPVHGPGEIANWIGPVGATFAHHALSMMGMGAWLVLLSVAGYLAHIAWRGPIDHAWVRGVGVVMVALAISGFQALLAPKASSFPEGGGGLIAINGVHELSLRFGALGAGLWIATLGAIGATVAFDRWLIIAPRYLRDAGRVGGTVAVGMAGASAAAVRKLQAQRHAGAARERDSMDQMRELMRAAAKRQKKQAAAEEDDDAPASARPARPAKPLRPPAERPEPVVSHAPDIDEDDDADPSDAYETDVALDTDAGDDDDAAPASRAIDPEALKETMAKLPVRFANATKKLASEEDLDSLRAQRASEEQAERNYAFPGLDLLSDPEESYARELEAYVREQAHALENALRTYRIDGHVVGVDSGPVITLYQVLLTPGTKVSSISAVSSDIARMLKATNIRIVANTEGLDTVGIEVPNRKKEKVRLKELMATTETTARMKLPLFLGKDASGAPLVVDLASLPHMLIAGTTGSGKSVCMNAVIMGFLYTQKPSDLKLVLVDPKMVELSQFRDIPHLMCPVVTDMGKAAAILEWAVQKMDERYELLAEAGCRDITAYNSLGWDELRDRLRPTTELEEAKIPRKLPYMVFVIDELADMMMTNKEVETSIVRIAQKARAVGIHLILATQRPQANVVTGLIKSNMPGRLSFKVASAMDSRIVLDQKGGELLLGQGDMLMVTPRSSIAIRAQGTLVDDGEIRRVVKWVRDNAQPAFEGQLVAIGNHGYEAQIHEDRMRESAQEDPLFDRAVEMVIEEQRGSVSMLQRRLAIGYTRAARLIEMMGDAGIIGGHKGTVAREVVMTIEEWQAIKAMAEAEFAALAQQEDAGLFARTTPPAPARPAFEEPPPFDIASPAAAPIIEHKPAADEEDDDLLAEEDTELEDELEDEIDEETEEDLEDAADDDEEYEEDEEELEDEADEDAEVEDSGEEVEEEDDAELEDEADDSDEEEEEDDAELTDEEEEDDEEYEYVYVDENGNPVDPNDPDYELVDEDEEEEEDEEESAPPSRKAT
jgi:S-DNA-T family DNA segregation ATPase FtsK/SpoIIIE